MTADHRENLSAGVDGELSAEALRFLLRRLDHDAELRQAWSRYQLIGEHLRREGCAPASVGFADRVCLALDHDMGQATVTAMSDAVRMQGGPHARRWLRWSAGGAIAASVAAVALMATQPAGERGVAAGRDASRPLLAAASTGGQASSSATAAAAPRWPGVAAAVPVPAWLSNTRDVSQLSEQATATWSPQAPVSGQRFASPYALGLAPYTPDAPTYRTLDNRDGSYLLLIDTPAASASAGRAAARSIAQ